MPESLEDRLTKVEQDLASLKTRFGDMPVKRGWISAISGSFKDDLAFDDILRLGKELRDADRPEDDR